MEVIAINFDGIEIVIRNDDPFGIVSVVQFSANLQATARLGACNEVNDHLVTDQGASTPVHGDEREQSVLDLVPFARAGWKVVHLNVQPGLLGEPTELKLPQTNAMAVAAPAIGSDDQLLGLRVALDAHVEPPTADSLHGECRGVVIGAYADPSLVSAQVVDPIRIGASKRFVDEVMNLDFHRLPAG